MVISASFFIHMDIQMYRINILYHPAIHVNYFKIFASGETLVFQFGRAEVNQEADFYAGGIQVIDELGLVFRDDAFDGFQFDDDFFFYQSRRKSRLHCSRGNMTAIGCCDCTETLLCERDIMDFS